MNGIALFEAFILPWFSRSGMVCHICYVYEISVIVWMNAGLSFSWHCMSENNTNISHTHSILETGTSHLRADQLPNIKSLACVAAP